MDPIQQLAERILAGPSAPDKDFIASKYTYADVYDLAAGFVAIFSRPGMSEEQICICTEDRGIVAAALIAALACGPALILPYSMSAQVLSETREILRFTYAISDGTVDLPRGIRGLAPERGSWEPRMTAGPRDVNSVFLRLFTGGSMGKPAVWSKTPVNMLAESDNLRLKYRIVSGDLIASTVPPYHIYGLLYTVLVPFLASATVLERNFAFPLEIVGALKDNPVTVLVSVPVHYRILKRMDIEARHLRIAFSSAGPLDRDDGVYFYDQTGVGVEEIYGSTETGGVACRCAATGRELLEPFAWVECRIRDERICVKSLLVSPDLPVDGQGFYMTGDRARFVSADRFTLLGRADGVVKVGGKRVDMNDVQEKIKRIPGIRDAFVVSLPGRKGRDTDIAAMVECDIAEAELRRVLSEKFEPFAVPRRLRLVDKIPSTSTGKYDREAIMELLRGVED
jgi:acyl-coenzyme A synthetase/AMP-(fatty) acid ligase